MQKNAPTETNRADVSTIAFLTEQFIGLLNTKGGTAAVDSLIGGDFDAEQVTILREALMRLARRFYPGARG